MRAMLVFIFICVCGLCLSGSPTLGAEGDPPKKSADIRTLTFPTASDIQRAQIHYIEGCSNPRAALVLCPGDNSNGRYLIESTDWQDFAKKEKLTLFAISYASPQDALNKDKGYYDARGPSGSYLEQAVHRVVKTDVPILIYGFSGGAHFTSHFVEYKPQKVLAWCAYSASWWIDPQNGTDSPPGIVACGDRDGQRYGPSLIYFKKGRAMGKNWTWASIANTGHSPSAKLEVFVRHYFSIQLAAAKKEEWREVDTGKQLTEQEAKNQPTLASWLPDSSLVPLWQSLQQP